MLVALWMSAFALAGSPASLTVTVTNPDGEPIGTSIVVHPKETDRHRVNQKRGSWKATALYFADGSQQVFAQGDVLDFAVFAPGHGWKDISVTLDKENTEHVVVLDKVSFQAPEDAKPEATLAYSTHNDWIAASNALLTDRSDANIQAATDTRSSASKAARAWLDAGGGLQAWTLCRYTGSAALCGAKP